MKKNMLAFLLILNSIFGYSQDTTKVLFIGNSFTSVNNLSSIFSNFAQAANRPIKVASHEPGGVSVGDISQGTSAHAANPVVYALIKSEKWDYVIIQDNQGRFVLDSAQFPSTSLVIKGHLQLRDSVRANNSCAKILWFAGWAVKNGYPPYGNTGIEMIDRLLVNYRVLNDTAKDVICPIGEAWKKGITLLPTVDLWSSDETHPSLAGSYLTAATIYATIFQTSPVALSYTAGLPSSDAQSLRDFAWQVISDNANRSIYNLGGVNSPQLWANGNTLNTNQYIQYQWYKENIIMENQNDSVIVAPETGAYYVRVLDNDGCYLKSCAIDFVSSDIRLFESDKSIHFFPNPITDNKIAIENELNLSNMHLYLYDISGRLIYDCMLLNTKFQILQLPILSKGAYIYHVKTSNQSVIKSGKWIVN